MTGVKLEKIQSASITYGNWKKLHPYTLILSRNTGFPFIYTDDPYKKDEYDYYTDNSEQGIWFPLENKDDRLQNKDLVLGISVIDKYKAYRLEDIKNKRLINDRIGDNDLVLFYNQDTDISRFFLSDLEREELEFELKGNTIFDKETNSEWNFDGKAVNGELKGKQLTSI